MNTSDREALLEVLQGVALGGITLIVFIIFVVFLRGQNKPFPKFETVDEYRGCDVVRYVPRHSSGAHYFLDCSK